MAVKLWTVHFMRICVANLLLFISLYMLFPVLPVEMAERLGVPIAQTGVIFLFFTVGMFLIGPFHAYLVDAYKRKYVCMFAFALMVAAAAGYAFVTNITELILLSTVQGLAFGIATTAGITLAIDITNSTLRSAGNVSFSWMARLGMIIGIALGVWLYQHNSFRNLLTISVVTGAVGILMSSGVYVPFRAPFVTKLYSFDRFLLLRGWVPAINLILITFVPGLLIPLVHPFLNDATLGELGISIPFFAGVGVGYLVSLLVARFLLLPYFSKLKEMTMRLVMMGILLEILAMLLLAGNGAISIVSVILGLGLGLVMPEFLVMFVKLSHHCQRGTANTTHLLASEVGIALGIAVACYMDMDTDRMLYIGQIVASVALLFFVLITHPYYKRKKVR
ncbi:MFS transporter [uncultured Bacteroides sp.]|uniref:MFS transporter n=1 Tax=uncultured Bacteroides sp. TaxID=162156 RepID=UPI0025E9052C|nr:MFS transporter [uncultured Bacteroides sp.]